MNATFVCPSCHQAERAEFAAADAELSCPNCGRSFPVSSEAIDGGRLKRCLVCPSVDLYVRKDFPQRLGVGLVLFGLAASCVAWGFHHTYLTFAILFATAMIDLALYLVVPNTLMCYRCGAQYRGTAELESHGPFNLETHERHRQQKARLAEHKTLN